MKKILLLVFYFYSLTSFGESSANEYSKKIQSQLLKSAGVVSETELSETIKKTLTELNPKTAKKKVLGPAYKLISFHFEICFIKKIDCSGAEKEHALLNKILTTNKISPDDSYIEIYLKFVKHYLNERSDPQISLIHWRFLSDTPTLMRNAEFAKVIWKRYIAASLAAGDFKESVAISLRWLSEAKSDSERVDVILEQAHIAWISQNADQLNSALSRLQRFKVNELQRFYVSFRTSQLFYLNNKPADCVRELTKGLAALPAPTKDELTLSAGLQALCLFDDKKLEDARKKIEVSRAAIEKSNKKVPNFLNLLIADLEISTAEGKKNPMKICEEIEPLLKNEESFQFLKIVTACAVLQDDLHIFPKNLRERYDTLTPTLNELAKKSDVIRVLLNYTELRFAPNKKNEVNKVKPELTKYFKHDLISRAISAEFK